MTFTQFYFRKSFLSLLTVPYLIYLVYSALFYSYYHILAFVEAFRSDFILMIILFLLGIGFAFFFFPFIVYWGVIAYVPEILEETKNTFYKVLIVIGSLIIPNIVYVIVLCILWGLLSLFG